LGIFVDIEFVEAAGEVTDESGAVLIPGDLETLGEFEFDFLEVLVDLFEGFDGEFLIQGVHG
jgi:hypothetical protein